MLGDKYELRYLPLFEKELNYAISYIAFHLENIEAANRLLDKVESSILDRLNNNPEGYEMVHSKKERKNDYYRIYVDNYIIYYVILEENSQKIMEVRRFLHTLQNRDDKIWLILFEDQHESVGPFFVSWRKMGGVTSKECDTCMLIIYNIP